MSRSLPHLCVIGFLLFGSLQALGLSKEVKREPVGIVIPHHDMVASARRAYLSEVSSRIQPGTIVLLSPDHFGTNQHPLVASSRVWQTSVGEYVPDLDLIAKLGIPQDAADFLQEHGVTGLLRDLKSYFPKSRIVPVMVSQQASYAVMEEFTATLYEQCSRCLLVASVDFSHSSEVNVADIHDRLTLRELYRGSATGLYTKAEVDSPQSLSALALWARHHEAARFNLFSHTNSGYLSGQTVGEMTTHIIGGYSPGEVVQKYNDSVFLMFGGDVIFARGVHDTYVTRPAETLTAGLGDRFFWGVDRAVVNLEGVFTASSEFASGWEELPPRLRFHPSFVKSLTAGGIDTVSLANNHSEDGGDVDFRFTNDLLKGEGVAALIHPDEFELTAGFVKSGRTKVVIIGVATHRAMIDLTPMIIKYKEDDHRIIIMPHWGDEYTSLPSMDQQTLAERWIKAGADLIVGSHPHVIQQVGVHRGVPIVYSLGNLLFDQNESTATQVGLVLTVEVDNTGVRLATVPVGSYLRTQPIRYDLETYLTSWMTYRDGAQDQVFYFPFKSED